MPGVVVLIFCVFILVAIGVAVASHQALKRRRQELADFAAQRGFTFTVEDEMNLSGHLAEFALVRDHSSGTVRHVLVGDDGDRQVILFEFVYVTGSGKHRHTHTQFCATWQLPAGVSRLRVRPEGFFERIGDWFTGRDIDFTEDVAFSGRFSVAGDDEAEVRAFLTPSARCFLLQCGLEHLEVVGDMALFYGLDKLDTTRCQELLDLSRELDRAVAPPQK
jgi:hypothetical protein